MPDLIAVVVSATAIGESYEVRRTHEDAVGDDIWTCECKSYQFRGGRCRHIEAVQESLEAGVRSISAVSQRVSIDDH